MVRLFSETCPQFCCLWHSFSTLEMPQLSLQTFSCLCKRIPRVSPHPRSSSQGMLTWLVGNRPDVTYWCVYAEGGLECATAHLVYTPKAPGSITIVTLESSDWLTEGLGYWLHVPSWMHPHSLVRFHTWYSNTSKPSTNTSHLSASLLLQFTQPLASPLTSYSLLTQALKEQGLSITGPFTDISPQTGCLTLL